MHAFGDYDCARTIFIFAVRTAISDDPRERFYRSRFGSRHKANKQSAGRWSLGSEVGWRVSDRNNNPVCSWGGKPAIICFSRKLKTAACVCGTVISYLNLRNLDVVHTSYFIVARVAREPAAGPR